jgi:Fic-DOC domain mobile mystery protein B
VTIDPGYPDGATPLDPDEMEGLKHKHVTARSELDELEQSNILEGLRWLSTARVGEVLSDEFALVLHKRLFGGVWSWAGMIRRTEKNIGIDPLNIRIELRTLMDDAQYWKRNKTYPPKEAAVRIHHRLVSIHPFANGNGRHARIMADTVLKRVYGADPIDWAGGQDLQHMNDRRTAYIAALRSADRGDFGPLFEFAGIGI